MPRLSNVRVRNVATVGGSLAHADPHMDLPPILSALGARARLVSPTGERTLPVEALITGYYESALRGDELIAEIAVPVRAGRRAVYLKCTTRSADDWPALGVAVSMHTDGKAIRSCTVVIGAAVDRPTRATRAEALLNGNTPDDGVLRHAADAAAAELSCQSDAQGSAEYKKELVRVFVARALRKALTDAPQIEH